MDNTQPENKEGSLLLVDDDLSALQTMEAFLVREGYEVRCALDGHTAQMFAREDPPELILLDVRLPDMDGFEVCRSLKEDQGTRDIPVIFISGLGEVVDKVKGFEAGGVDYITKPFQGEEMLARVGVHLTLSRLHKKVEAQNAQLQREITERKRAEEALQRAHDELEERVKERTVDLATANEQLVSSERRLEERLRFEALISGLSSAFVNLSPNEVDSEISKGLCSITEFFDADRCTIELFSEDGTQLARAFEYRSSVADQAPKSISKEQMPWYIEQMIWGKPVVMNRLEDLPAEAERERQVCLAKGMKSFLSMPMVSRGVPLGSCALVSTRERVWSEELVNRFRLVSEVFANALQGKRADTLLQTSEEKFRQFFAHTPEFCYIVSSDGVILDVNDWALHGLGYEREDLLGKPLSTVYAPESIPKMKDLFARWKEKGEIRNEEMAVITKKGEKRTVLLNVGAVRDKDGAILHSTSVQTDITERKQAEAEVNRGREQLLHVERSARMGELTASLAHELNQPLAAILINAQAALRFLQSNKVNLDELREILHDIIQDDQRAGNVIRSLRSMMKREERERNPIILNNVLNEVIQIFHTESIFRNVHIDTEFDESLPPVLGDKVQLQQVVLNLIVNAADAMSQNPPEHRRIILGTQVKNDRIKVTIRDFGPGIDRGSLDRIFQPFFTTKGTGLGMGLAVSHTIVEAHGGHIWAENHPGGGATFFIELPIFSNQ